MTSHGSRGSFRSRAKPRGAKPYTGGLTPSKCAAAIRMVRGYIDARQQWGPSKTSLVASEIIRTSKETKIPLDYIIDRTLRRDRDAPILRAIAKQLAFKNRTAKP